MWHPTSKINQMEKHITEDDKKQQQRKEWKCDDDEYATGNVDSGFLSGGNLQSDEISDLELQPREEGRQGEGEQRVAPGTTLIATESSSSSAVIEEEPMRAIDSGLDLDLTESLSQLSLKQVSLNRLDSGKLSEPTTPKLTRVTGNPILDNTKLEHDELLQQQQGDSGSYDERAINEESWQLYYAQDDDGDTQLHIAIVQGFVEAAIWLINMVPDPCLLDTLNDDWQSPLHLAVLTHESLIVRRLILAGADPSVRNFRGNTALHLACASGDFACAKALTDPLSLKERKQLTPEKKVPVLPQDLEQPNYNGEVCLHVATVNGHVDVVRLLLSHGADLRTKEGLAGYTALHLAVERECRPVFDFLLHESQRISCLDERTYRGRTAYQMTLDINSDFAREARRELMRCGATPEPLPESDFDSNSDSSEDEDTRSSWSMDYLPAIKTQNAVGVTV